MGWENSDRWRQLPRDWGRRRLEVARRAGDLCQAPTHELGCDGRGTECDHVGDRDDHSLTNLQWLSAECHAAKTIRERPASRRRRAPRRHPGG